jgi:phenylacetate-CoA ligase
MTGRDVGFQHPEFETLERDDIVKIQDAKLAKLAQRLSDSPEWVAHFAKAGMTPADIADRDSFPALPTLEKADLRALYPYPMLTVPMDRVARFFATSGTTGPPVMFGFTRDDLDWMARHTARMLRCVGFRPGDKVFNGHGFGLWIGGPAMNAGVIEAGGTVFPVGPGRGELVVQWLVDHGFTGVTASPYWLIQLAGLAREKGIDPKTDWKLRVSAFGGQPVSAALLDQVESILPDGFMAQVCYGSTEAGGPFVSAACPYTHDHDEMHIINDDAVLTEILDPETLKPVGPGEVGEIVITTLDKQASPVVRWRTRDLVQIAGKPYDCPCGRKGLTKIGLIVGRSDDMLKIRGTIVFPSQIEDVVTSTMGTVKEAWQVVVDKEDRLLEAATVEIERAASVGIANDVLADTVARSLTSRLGLRVDVTCHDEGTLPRYDGKAIRVIKKG